MKYLATSIISLIIGAGLGIWYCRDIPLPVYSIPAPKVFKSTQPMVCSYIIRLYTNGDTQLVCNLNNKEHGESYSTDNPLYEF